MNSNEGSFMAISRFILRDWPGWFPRWGWYPFWFNGMPFENSYTPLLQFLDAAFAKLAHCSTPLAFHFVTASFYCLGPAFLFLFAWKLSGLLETSLSAALLYSVFSPSAIFWLVRIDMFGWRHARRLQTLVHYGEGAHNAVLCLLPLALLLVYLAISRRRFYWYVAAGVAFSALVLINAFGAVDLALGIGCLLLAFAPELRIKTLGALGAVAVLSYLWISPLLPPALIQTIRVNSQMVGGDFRYTPLTLAVAVLLLAGAFGLAAATRRVLTHFEQFAVLIAYVFTAIPSFAFLFKIYLAPQPERYHLEMELGLCLAFIFLARRALLHTGAKFRMAVLLIFVLFIARQTITYSRYARTLLRPIVIASTIEYKISKWIDTNLRGLRTMVSDETGTWFNVWSDNPQFNSGHDPFCPNWMVEVAIYAIYSGQNAGDRDAEVAITWLKAYGNHAISVPGPHSREVYKPFRHPEKFAGVLPALWHDEDDTIYAVPQRTTSLAHVIPIGRIVQHPPSNGLDLKEVAEYVAALDDPRLPLAPMTWRSTGEARIVAPVEPGQLVSVQVTYDPGWKAVAQSRPVPITKDAIGLMALHPECRGYCEIVLSFEGGRERKLCWLASMLVTLGVLSAMVYRALRPY